MSPDRSRDLREALEKMELVAERAERWRRRQAKRKPAQQPAQAQAGTDAPQRQVEPEH